MSIAENLRQLADREFGAARFNPKLSTEKTARYGHHGSVAVELEGEKAGTWFDHEHGTGGRLSDGADRSRKPRGPRTASVIYSYKDAAGREIARVKRTDLPGGEKKFSQCRPDGNGGWEWKGPKAPTPLYQLDVLAANPDAMVLIAEGEKACVAAQKLAGGNFVATSWMGGSDKVAKADWAPLAGRDCLVWPDADAAGHDAARDVVEQLRTIASSVHVLRVNDLPAKADAADVTWTAEEILARMEVVEPAEAKPADISGLLYEFADELPAVINGPNEIVETLFARPAMGVLYGPTNSGKTFVAMDIGAAVDLGTPWMGLRVESGLVVYLATESPTSVRTRLQAYQQHHQVRLHNFVVVRSPIDLYDGDADTEKVIALIRGLEAARGKKCQLVVGDTWARLTAGGNENSGQDMSVVIRHGDRIQRECDVHLLFIHHTGKDLARGMRGWSGILGAIDTELEVTRNELTSDSCVEVTKQRDLASKGARYGFRLQRVEIGTSKWGTPMTSCIVIPNCAPPKVEPGRRLSEIAGAISELLTTRGCGMRKSDIVKHFDSRYDKSAVYRELKKMALADKVAEIAGVIGLKS